MDSNYIVAGNVHFHKEQVEGKDFEQLSSEYPNYREHVIKELVSKLRKLKPKKVEKVVKPKGKPTKD